MSREKDIVNFARKISEMNPKTDSGLEITVSTTYDYLKYLQELANDLKNSKSPLLESLKKEVERVKEMCNEKPQVILMIKGWDELSIEMATIPRIREARGSNIIPGRLIETHELRPTNSVKRPYTGNMPVRYCVFELK